jgi:hypothetical protein
MSSRLIRAERGLDHLHNPDDVVRLFRAHAKWDRVDPAQIFEQQRLAFHHGQAGLRTDVTEPEYAGAVGNDGDRVRLVGMLVDQLRIFLDLATGRGDARRVPDGEVLVAGDRAFRQYLHLASVEWVKAKGLLCRPFGTRRWLIPFRHPSSLPILPAAGRLATDAPIRECPQDQRR